MTALIVIYFAIAILLSLTAFRTTYKVTETEHGKIMVGTTPIRDSFAGTMLSSILWPKVIVFGLIHLFLLRKKIIRRN